MRSLNGFKMMVAAMALMVAGCSSSDDKPPLEGERLSILQLQQDLTQERSVIPADQFKIPAAWSNKNWPQAGGYPSHALMHVSLSGTQLEKIWTTSIGQGSTSEIPLTTQPVLAARKIFTMDGDLVVRAFDTETGEELWEADVSRQDEGDVVIGGGLAYAGQLLFVTNGYDELITVNPGSGEIVSRTVLPSASRAAPMVIDERIFISTLDNRLIALDHSDRKTLWEYQGLTETSGLLGAATPAANRDIVVPAFSSGEVYALQVENGSVAWGDNLTPLRHTGGLQGMTDIKASPVIHRGVIYALSFGGRLVAIDERTGQRKWQRQLGGSEMPWIADDYIYVLSTENEVVCLSQETGEVYWIAELPRFEDDDRDEPLQWQNPMLAGGRLLLVGSHGEIRELDPRTGEVLREWDSEIRTRIAPIVANDTLYLLSEGGKLAAFK